MARNGETLLDQTLRAIVENEQPLHGYLTPADLWLPQALGRVPIQSLGYA